MVVQPDHIAQGDFVALKVVEKTTAKGVVVQWPASGVHHQTRLGFVRRDFPEFFDANGKGLCVFVGVQLEFFDELFAQVAASAFGKHGVLGVQLHAQLEVIAGLTVFAHAEVAGGHALDRTVLVVEHLSSGKARENFHAQGLGLLAQPLAHRP